MGRLLLGPDEGGHEVVAFELGGVDVQEECGKIPPALGQLQGPLTEQCAQLGLRACSRGDPEKLLRQLRQPGVPSPAEGLVAGQRAAGKAHDRLEEHHDLTLLEELRQLVRSLDELLGKGLVTQGHGRRLERLLVSRLDLLAPQAILDLGDVQNVSLAQPGVLDPLAVHERAVLASEIDDPKPSVLEQDLGVLFRHGVGAQREAEAREAAEPKGERTDRGAPELAPSFNQALQVPAKNTSRRW